VELVNRMLTGNNLHFYINPERDSEEGALNVHGLTTEFLSDKPKFHEIVDDLREYIQGAEVIIHNAPFDLGFLNHEFKLLNLPDFSPYPWRDRYAGACQGTASGQAQLAGCLCDRYGISNAHRKLHGALLDSELLADVYLAMTRGQNSLGMDVEEEVVVAGEELEWCRWRK
jgi:DNA polymerase-3 subunit epsilon